MLSGAHDRWLWIGFGVFFIAAAKGIAYGLNRIEQSNTLLVLQSDNEDEKPASRTANNPETTIPVDALFTLTRSPNREIADVATDILVKRLFSSEKDGLSWYDDLFSEDHGIRRRAAMLLNMRQQAFPYNRMAAPLTIGTHEFDLLVLITISVKSSSIAASTIRTAYRHARNEAIHARRFEPMKALSDLSSLLTHEYTVRVFVAPNMQVMQVIPWSIVMVRLCDERPTSSEAAKLAWAIRIFKEAGEEGNRAPGERARSLSPPPSNSSSDSVSDDDVSIVEAPTTGASDGVDVAVLRPRFSDESPEERQLRRRRREAMVWRDGPGDIVESFIIEPRRTIF